jgi:hypothetical protein
MAILPSENPRIVNTSLVTRGVLTSLSWGILRSSDSHMEDRCNTPTSEVEKYPLSIWWDMEAFYRLFSGAKAPWYLFPYSANTIFLHLTNEKADLHSSSEPRGYPYLFWDMAEFYSIFHNIIFWTIIGLNHGH